MCPLRLFVGSRTARDDGRVSWLPQTVPAERLRVAVPLRKGRKKAESIATSSATHTVSDPTARPESHVSAQGPGGSFPIRVVADAAAVADEVAASRGALVSHQLPFEPGDCRHAERTAVVLLLGAAVAD